MSDVFGISVSALQAFQNAINVTSNNVANASTPGYDRETVNLTEAIPQSNGTATVGAGVVVAGISRAYSQAAANQLNASQSSLGQLNALQNYSTQIDNLFGTTVGGLSTTLQSFYSAFSDVANDPTSTASRQALLGQAQNVASSFQNASGDLNSLNTDVNSRITADVQQINSIATAISTLNQQIVVATAQGGNQPPNELLDQRDQLVSNLSQLVGVSTTTDADGSLNVFVGNGQPLVLQGQTTPLTTVQNQFNASQLEIGTSQGSQISSDITSGDLGGLLAARSQVINPALNQLGQIATALSQTVNSQQSDGLDLSGNLGANIFSVGAPLATASSKNTDAVTASVSVNANGLGALTADNYLLTFKAGAPTADRYHHRRQRDSGGRRYGRQSLHGQWRFHRSVGSARGRRSVLDSAHGHCGRKPQRGADRSFENRGGRRDRDRGGRHQHRRGHHQPGYGPRLRQPQLAAAGHHSIHQLRPPLIRSTAGRALPMSTAATSM